MSEIRVNMYVCVSGLGDVCCRLGWEAEMDILILVKMRRNRKKVRWVAQRDDAAKCGNSPRRDSISNLCYPKH